MCGARSMRVTAEFSLSTLQTANEPGRWGGLLQVRMWEGGDREVDGIWQLEECAGSAGATVDDKVCVPGRHNVVVPAKDRR